MNKWIPLFLASTLFIFLLSPINISRCAPSQTLVGTVAGQKTITKTGTGDVQIIKESKKLSLRLFGGIVLFNQLSGGVASSGLPRECTTKAALIGLGVNLLIFALIAAQFLAYLLGHLAFKLEDPTTYLSREYMFVFWTTLPKSVLGGILTWVITNFLMSIPLVANWLTVNTSIHTSGQAAVPFAALAFLIPLLATTFRNELFSTMWERLFFFAEVVLFVHEIFFLLLNIDLLLVLLSVPFPGFSNDFDPFMPGEWKFWIKEFKAAPRHEF